MRLAFALIFVAGCFNPDFGVGHIGCSAGVCPEGYHCATDKACWKDGTDPEGPDLSMPDDLSMMVESDGGVDLASADLTPLPCAAVCGAVCCKAINGTCDSACKLTCDSGFDDCNSDVTDGCEVNLTNDKDNCSACDHVCPLPAHGVSTSCAANSCGFTCEAGLAPNGLICDTAPPRLIAPLSTATVTRLRPTLRWELAAGTTGAKIEICTTRDCSTIFDTFEVNGTSGTPTKDLTASTVFFWRARSKVGATVAAANSPVWEFAVPKLSATADTSWGSFFDFNGDGFADVVVGAPYAELVMAMVGNGQVYLYRGGQGAKGLPNTPAPTGVIIGPDGQGGSFGNSVSSAGDVNGDGYADLIVVAPNVEVNGVANAGQAYLYLGGPNVFTGTPPVTTWPAPTRLHTTGALLHLGGTGTAGRGAAAAGDVNGDGYGDVILGGDNKAYVYTGSATGLDPTRFMTLQESVNNNDRFGEVVSSAGDIDGDGIGDVMVGASAFFDGTKQGSVHIFMGSSTGLPPTATTKIQGVDGAGTGMGYGLAACDFNGDGYCDVAAGVPYAPMPNSNRYGLTYVFTSKVISTVRQIDNNVANASKFDGPVGATETNAQFGKALAAADFNNDGYCDLAVGASFSNSLTGKVYFYAATASGFPATVPSPSPSPGPWTGSNTGEIFGENIASAGDLNGDGFSDLLVGSSNGLGYVSVFNGGVTMPAAATTTINAPVSAQEGKFGYSVH